MRRRVTRQMYKYVIGINICRLKEVGPNEQSCWLFTVGRELINELKNGPELVLGVEEGTYRPDVAFWNIIDFVFY